MQTGKPIMVNESEMCEMGHGLSASAFMLDWHGNGGRDILYTLHPNYLGCGVYLYKEDIIRNDNIPVYNLPIKLEGLTGWNAIPLQTISKNRFNILTYGKHPRKINGYVNIEKYPGWLKLYKNTGTTEKPQFVTEAEPIKVKGLSLDEAIKTESIGSINTAGLFTGNNTDLIITTSKPNNIYWPGGISGWEHGDEHPDVGFGRGYNKDGTWKGKPVTKNIYILRNNGTDETLCYGAPELIYSFEAFDSYVDAAFLDVDKDGVAELVIRKDIDRMYCLKLIDGNVAGKPIKMECSPLKRGYFQTSLCICDLDKDKEPEFLVTGNPGVVLWIDFKDGKWEEQKPLKTWGGYVRGETLSVPCMVDLDGDGDLDIIVGDSSGYIWYYENMSSKKNIFNFKSGRKLIVDGEEIHHQAGSQGSIQGPNESRWGYTNPVVYDWDGDGLLDIITNDIKGEYLFYKNIGSKEKPLFKKPLPFMLYGKPLKNAWRSRPAIWDKDTIVIATIDGLLQFFHKGKQVESLRQDPLSVEEGKILRYADGTAIKASGSCGHTGRVVLSACDWDNDGRTDLIAGTMRSITKLFNLHFPKIATLMWLKNVGTNITPIFERPRLITLKDGSFIDLDHHKCSPWCVDLDGDDELDIVCGAEDGKVYSWFRKDLKWDWDPETVF
ncbi:MAG TPA: FG-GAP-like repeat-containing protein [Clostridiales bacterium]|nr:FG-GAP-like repeat-containing protein [Clostridiales bacterium]